MTSELFKYSTEACLNVISEECRILSVDILSEINDLSYLDKFNIYAIVARPCYYFDNEKISTDSNGLNFSIVDIQGKVVRKIIEFRFPLFINGNEIKNYDYNQILIESEPPCTRLNIKLCPSDDHLLNIMNELEYDFIRIEEFRNVINDFNLVLDVENILSMLANKNRTDYDFEVLYIGQAYGREKYRSAIDRLKCHETLQKILIDCHTKFTNRRLFVMLFRFSEQQIMFINGFENKFSSNKNDEEKHFQELVNDSISIVEGDGADRLRQVINITEAAMINYFKPEYNKNFVNNFPSLDHKSYQHYFDLEYNAISIDLQLYGPPQVSLYTKENKIASMWEFIQYEMYKNDRASIFDLFSNRKLNKG